MTNFVQSLFDGMRDRIRNPIIPAFVFAWLAVNWQRVFLLLASTKTAEERAVQYSESEWPYWLSILTPVTIAAAYVLGMPWVIVGLQRAQAKPEGLQRGEKILFEKQLAEGELKLAQTRKEIAGIESAAMFEDRVRDLERQVETLNENLAVTASGDDSSEVEEARQWVRDDLQAIDVSPKLADRLHDAGFGGRHLLKKMDNQTALGLEAEFPQIRNLVTRAGGDASAETSQPNDGRPQ
jgi:hypothetical protein